MDKQLDFSNLVPDLFGFILGDIPLSTSQGFSTFIVLVLVVLTLYFSLSATRGYFQARASVSFFKKQLIGYSSDDLFAKREEINEKMDRFVNGHAIWQEFDESLVCVKQSLYNTLDASHFFNNYSLARTLTDNRLLAAVPGFLTAIGVIGTFAGLQIGLSEIQSAGFGEDASVDNIKEGILSLIHI